MVLFVWILVALVAAFAVMGVAAAEGRTWAEVRQFLAGVFTRPRNKSVAVPDLEVEDVSVSRIFEIGEHPKTAYLPPPAFAESVVRFTQRAVAGLTRR